MVIIWPGTGLWLHHPVCKRPGRVRCAGAPLPMSPVPAPRPGRAFRWRRAGYGWPRPSRWIWP